MKKELLNKYARLLVKTGVNIQKDQILVIYAPIECSEFVRIIAGIAFGEGARDVVINYRDELFSKIRYMMAPEEVFEEFPKWQSEFYNHYAREEAAFLSISASDPELMKEVDPGRIAKAYKARALAIKEYNDRLMENKNTWCVASIPTVAWAKKVFPNIGEDEAVTKLWESIFHTVRVDKDNPVAEWEVHKNNLKKSMEFLNSNEFKFLKYRNSLGTALTIELPENHLWLGGSDYTTKGVEFIANMPTEEVFTLPKKTGVNGKVVSSMPLNYNGNLINKFSLTFKEGRVVAFSAEEGYEILKSIIDTDEGSAYLGEVALVPYDSPISNSNILFYNTLFDENASCHLALGKAYPVCIKNSDTLKEEELINLGMNDSIVHEDFMVGTRDLEIIGIKANGEELIIFKNGNFAY